MKSNKNTILQLLFFLLSSLYTGAYAETKLDKDIWQNLNDEEYIEAITQCRIDLKKLEWNNTLWPKKNKISKPEFEQVFNEVKFRNDVLKTLKMEKILFELSNVKLDSFMLENEIFRIVKNTRAPEKLTEIFQTLDNQPFKIVECLIRPNIINRLIKEKYYWSDKVHNDSKIMAKNYLDQYLESGNLNNGKTKLIRFVLENSGKKKKKYEVNQDDGVYIQEIDALTLKNKLSKSNYDIVEHKYLYSYEEIINESESDILIKQITWPKIIFDEWIEKRLHGNKLELRRYNDLNIKIPKISNKIDINNQQSLNAGLNPKWRIPDLPVARGGYSAVWTGIEMIIFGGTDMESEFQTNTGSRYNPVFDTWSAITDLNAPQPRSSHSAVWTGTEMIIWGGYNSSLQNNSINSGSRYNPTLDTWKSIPIPGENSQRFGHSGIWTGSEMIVWGGTNGDVHFNTGFIFDPALETWRNISNENAPSSRSSHTAIWTGTEMIVWGGFLNSTSISNTGGRYNPITDQWEATSQDSAPSRRNRHTAIWTGVEMIIWGGVGSSLVQLNTGGRYNPITDTWLSTTTSNAPERRYAHSAFWTGTEMIVWGGFGENGGFYEPQSNTWRSLAEDSPSLSRHNAVWTGSGMIAWGSSTFYSSVIKYNLNENSWTVVDFPDREIQGRDHSAIWTGNGMIVWGGLLNGINPGKIYDPITSSIFDMSTVGAPFNRELHTAIWTGNEMIIWGGGYSGQNVSTQGGIYDKLNDSWREISEINAPIPRRSHTAIWTGSEMIIWGGRQTPTNSEKGGRYNPISDSWSSMSVSQVPTARYDHTAIWTGSDMIMWGGRSLDGKSYFNNGSKYNPELDSWFPIASIDTTNARYSHSAIWSGKEMIIWGGNDGNNDLNSGVIYDPLLDLWTEISNFDAPDNRKGHSAIWTGEEMIVWGGKGTAGGGFPSRYNSGGHYNPVTDIWSPTSIENAPVGREQHRAIWTGKEMIVSGGFHGGQARNIGEYIIVVDLIFGAGFESL